MSDGIFGDLDLENAADDPFAIDDGTYEATITKCEVKTSEKNGVTKKGLAFTYTITTEGAMAKRNASEWKSIPTKDLPEDELERAKSYLKQRLLSIGIPNERINSFVPEDALGIDVVITVKNKDGYANVNRVALPEVEAGDTGSAFAGL